MKKTRVVFTQGGKGGVGKSEIAASLVPWYRQQGLSPKLLDFDTENTTKSGLQNFYPEARKLDVHAEGALDEFFEFADRGEGLVLADLGAGCGERAYQWFNDAYEDAKDVGLVFTAVGVATHDAGSVASVLTWGKHLQGRVDYLIVLNELNKPGCDFGYWKAEPAVEQFKDAFNPHIMVMTSRVQEFQAELRNQSTTLQRVIDGKTDAPYFKKPMNKSRARRYQAKLFESFDAAADILFPPTV